MLSNDFLKIFKLFFPKQFINRVDVRNQLIKVLFLLFIDITSAWLLAYIYKLIVTQLTLNNLHLVLINLWLLGACWITTKVISHFQEIIFFPVVNLAIRTVTYRVIEHLHRIPVLDYQKLSIQGVMNSIRRIGYGARAFLKTLILTMVPTLLKLIIAIAVAVNLGNSGWLLVPIVFIASIILYKGILGYSEIRKSSWMVTDQVIARINDSIINTKMIRSFSAEEMQQIMNSLNQEAEFWSKTNNQLHWIYIKIFSILGLGIVCILSGVVLSIKTGQLKVADFIFLKVQLMNAFIPFKNLIFELRQIADPLVDLKKIIEILEIPIIDKAYLAVKSKVNANCCIYFDKVTFSYEGKKPIITNLSMELFTGEKIIIVGKNGAGKTTLINLIAGLYHPTQGQIFFYGQNLKSFSREQLQSKIYWIHHDIKLFNDTIFYNITHGIAGWSKAKLLDFLKEFKFMDFIYQLPLGLDSIVGESGCNLSTGERQKIMIFRAFLIKPSLLLLDEATNFINYAYEQEILQFLYYYIPTVILVSHKNIFNNSLYRIINLNNIKPEPNQLSNSSIVAVNGNNYYEESRNE